MILGKYFIYIKTTKEQNHFKVEMTNNITQVLLNLKQSRLSNNCNDNTWKLVYYEYNHDKIKAEKRLAVLEKLPPSKRALLIERQNPCWRDLGNEWFR